MSNRINTERIEKVIHRAMSRVVASAALSLVAASSLPYGIASANAESLDDAVARSVDSVKFHGAHQIEIDRQTSGKIVLSGFVAAAEDVAAVERAVLETPGVSSLDNRLEVRGSAPSATGVGGVSPIALRVTERLAKAENGESYVMKVDEAGGVVTVTGVVPSAGARNRVLDLVRNVPGVKEVRSNISLQEPPADDILSERVSAALKRDAAESLSKVSITARSGIVTVTGDQPNHEAVDKVLSVVTMVDGVRDVKSQITVGGKPYYTDEH